MRPAAMTVVQRRGGTAALSTTPSDGIPLDLVWARVTEELDAPQRALVGSCKPLVLHDQTFMVAAPNDFTRVRLENRLRSRIEQELSEHYGRAVHLAVSIDPALHDSELSPPFDQSPAPEPEPEPDPRPTRPDRPVRSRDTARLNPKYTFETFVIGESNRFAHAAAVAVAEAPGKSYNPLLIYGPSGLGKTHLLHALGHYVQTYHQHLRVRYVSTEELTNDFINAIQDNQTPQFRRAYREVDVLLVDDIQFLESKIQTQEEFFHTFNFLHMAQKQIVMTSDRPPKLLEALEQRLRSRFESGLLTDIQPPDLETRIAILRRKAAAERLTVSPEVLEFIGSKIQSNIRELEGALIRVTAYASLNGRTVDLALAGIVLKDLIPEGQDRPITSKMIIEQAAAHFQMPIDELTGPGRAQSVATARQIAMYLCRELTDLSLPKIGQEFGGRDHTTVMHADRKIRDLIRRDRAIFTTVTELTNRIRTEASRR